MLGRAEAGQGGGWSRRGFLDGAGRRARNNGRHPGRLVLSALASRITVEEELVLDLLASDLRSG
jgi:hypothetical protein